MPAAARIYRQVSGRTAFLGGYHRLYEGPDHLLVVRSVGVREDYRRFFYRDLQAVIIRPTNRQRDNAVVWGALTAVSGLPAVASALGGVPVLPILLGVLAVIFGALLLRNQLLGPTCECHLQTAVQCEPLPALRRMNRAEKFLGQIRSRVADVQGVLTPEELLGRLALQRAAVVHAATAAPSDAGLPPVIEPGVPTA